MDHSLSQLPSFWGVRAFWAPLRGESHGDAMASNMVQGSMDSNVARRRGDQPIDHLVTLVRGEEVLRGALARATSPVEIADAIRGRMYVWRRYLAAEEETKEKNKKKM